MANELDIKWFDLKKYEGLKSLNFTEWADQIEYRYYMNMYVSYDHQHDILSENEAEKIIHKLYESAKDMLEEIKINPIIEKSGAVVKRFLISKIPQPSLRNASRLSTAHPRGAPCQSIVSSFKPACRCLNF